MKLVRGWEMVKHEERTYTDNNCGTIAILPFFISCRCTHLTEFAAVYHVTELMVGSQQISGFYTEYHPLEKWATSLGFYIAVSAIVMYSLGVFAIMELDKSQRQKRIRQMKHSLKRQSKLALLDSATEESSSYVSKRYKNGKLSKKGKKGKRIPRHKKGKHVSTKPKGPQSGKKQKGKQNG